VAVSFLAPTTSIVELILRSVAVYVFLMAALRVAGRREMGQLTNFDLVLLLILSNAVQNSINAGDNSLVGGLISALTLLTLNYGVGWAAYRWPWFERLVQGQPIRIVTDGRVHRKVLERERITPEQLRSALRKQGIERIGDCERVVLEPSGTLTAVKRGQTPRSMSELAHPDDECIGME
jgi:uncharacterized membrane protein YcaP (DUF421 family)